MLVIQSKQVGCHVAVFQLLPHFPICRDQGEWILPETSPLPMSSKFSFFSMINFYGIKINCLKNVNLNPVGLCDEENQDVKLKAKGKEN